VSTCVVVSCERESGQGRGENDWAEPFIVEREEEFATVTIEAALELQRKRLPIKSINGVHQRVTL
jgi:hypothetical protein